MVFLYLFSIELTLTFTNLIQLTKIFVLFFKLFNYKWYTRSKTCGNIKKDLSLNDKTYHCDYCGININHDYNASINIRNQGMKLVIF
ncbi:MAG: zinc ribbon domain-containing protein [Oscillospiraceae bacterium]